MRTDIAGISTKTECQWIFLLKKVSLQITKEGCAEPGYSGRDKRDRKDLKNLNIVLQWIAAFYYLLLIN